jgi:FAD/FMN-containing dehydrogenase
MFEGLRQVLRGDLVTAHDPDYDTARRVWNGVIDRRPRGIVRCRGVADVIAGVRFVTAENLPCSVRAGGHGVAGAAVCDGIVLDLSKMRSVWIDRPRLRARVEPGALWADLNLESQAFDLVTPGGIISSTGVAGLTLGGGIGWLMRKWGLSCDNLTSADVVTADGALVRASEDENADLLWALRGRGRTSASSRRWNFSFIRWAETSRPGCLFTPGSKPGSSSNCTATMSRRLPKS